MSAEAAEITVPQEDLVGIVESVWSSFLGANGDDGELVPRLAGDASDSLLTASVSVAGAWTGHVVVETSTEAARALTSAMLGLSLDELDHGDVTDALGEIANMVGGNVKSMVPDPSTLSLPVVVRGGAAALSWPEAAESVTAELVWRGEPVTATVWIARAALRTPGKEPS